LREGPLGFFFIPRRYDECFTADLSIKSYNIHSRCGRVRKYSYRISGRHVHHIICGRRPKEPDDVRRPIKDTRSFVNKYIFLFSSRIFETDVYRLLKSPPCAYENRGISVARHFIRRIRIPYTCTDIFIRFERHDNNNYSRFQFTKSHHKVHFSTHCFRLCCCSV